MATAVEKQAAQWAARVDYLNGKQAAPQAAGGASVVTTESMEAALGIGATGTLDPRTGRPVASTAVTAVVPSAADAAAAAARRAAVDVLKQAFANYGFDADFLTALDEAVKDDESAAGVMLKMYDEATPLGKAYAKRFPGMAALRKKGQAINEATYIDLETRMTGVMRTYDLPQGFADNREQLGKLIAGEVSPAELQSRLESWNTVARNTDQGVRDQLRNLYGLSDGDILAYTMNPDTALPLIQKRARAAVTADAGADNGFQFGQAQAEALAMDSQFNGLSEGQLRQGFSQAGVLNTEQQRLAALESDAFNSMDAVDTVFRQDAPKTLASQQRAARERARFGGSSGLSGSSLSQSDSGRL